MDVLISTLNPSSFAAQIPLANAAKIAGVKRFVPCSFATIAPPRGVMVLRDMKEDVFDHVKKIRVPYTIIDVGWWFQLSIPGLPSGRGQYATIMAANTVAKDGDLPSALTDSRDIGRWVARIIADEKTLNKQVFAYNEVMSPNQVRDLFERLSGEKIEYHSISEDSILETIDRVKSSKQPQDVNKLYSMQYLYSIGIRGDNTPEYAQYLGYLDANQLYPDVKKNSLQSFLQEVLDGKAVSAYAHKFAAAKN
ncbi:hypothetical protein PFICI_04726 [Pestalotiopsis fici W106-1]|uniref:NmrA-like domain-containing protein n=1 Tax=Pestalotiopsis fici (strain W106-1 / CGMCC3.15140) TaxID=1229662 RepID=W3X9W7_PESFW|nr:uncharacterized protein PFICI_04726 [Pestalotiopsis fici W106-1]ETS82850.1 hypothetical protein PFICI_04726 [Pestalotiopsis fici W106-1]